MSMLCRPLAYLCPPACMFAAEISDTSPDGRVVSVRYDTVTIQVSSVMADSPNHNHFQLRDGVVFLLG